jgi:hypothetical protein
LSLYAHIHNAGSSDTQSTNTRTTDEKVKVHFPGNHAGYNSLNTPTSAKTIARFAIFASLNRESCGGGQLFNIADRERPTMMKELWPGIVNWFGLEGVGPREEDEGESAAPEHADDLLKPGEYVKKHREEFRGMGLPNAASCGVSVGSVQLDSVGWWLTFDRQLNLAKLRGSGFLEEREPLEGWIEAFEGFRRAGVIL